MMIAFVVEIVVIVCAFAVFGCFDFCLSVFGYCSGLWWGLKLWFLCRFAYFGFWVGLKLRV